MKLMDMNANKKLIQKKMTEKTGNVVLLKDLSNIHAGKQRNNLDTTIKSLREKYGMHVSITKSIYKFSTIQYFVFSFTELNFKIKISSRKNGHGQGTINAFGFPLHVLPFNFVFFVLIENSKIIPGRKCVHLYYIYSRS